MAPTVRELRYTTGKGLKTSVGRAQVLSCPPSEVVGGLGREIQSIPPGEETWFSGSCFTENRRRAENWVHTEMAVVDVDYSDADGRHAVPPPDVASRVADLLERGQLPGSLGYQTPRGLRILFVLALRETDKSRALQILRGACHLVDTALAAAGLGRGADSSGLSVDPGSYELTRIFFLPNAIVRGTKRNAPLRLLKETPWEASDLVRAATASGAEKEPDPSSDAHRPPRTSSEFEIAAEAWNQAHPLTDAPAEPGDCPACRHRDCFGEWPAGSGRWRCFSTNHQQDSHGCGREMNNEGGGVRTGTGCGDALDLEAHRRGCKPHEVLRQDGYLGAASPKPPASGTNATYDIQVVTGGRAPRWKVVVCDSSGPFTTCGNLLIPDDRTKIVTTATSKIAGACPEELDRLLEKAAASWCPPESREKKPKTTDAPLLPFDEVEPAEDEVDLASLLDSVVAALKRILVLPEFAAEAVALWIAHTWAIDAFDYSPRLCFSSPEKRCGKTTALEAVIAGSCRVVRAENASVAALFRVIAAWSPTIVLDEADTFVTGRTAAPELLGILNAGARRGGTVLRCVGDNHEPTPFPVFAPVAFGLIGKLPPTLADRSIIIHMRRRMKDETIHRARPSEIRATFQGFAPEFRRWSQDNAEKLRHIRPTMPTRLDDRAQDMWEPLLSIAQSAGDSWARLAERAAVELSSPRGEDDSSAGIELLGNLRDLWRSTDAEYLPTQFILEQLNELEEGPWQRWCRGKPLHARELARLLRPFGISSQNFRTSKPRQVLKGYGRQDMTDAIDRYLDVDPLDDAATPLRR